VTTINAHRLQRIIKQIRPHVSPDDTLPIINGIRFECDGVHVHALATDRYTFAAARVKVREETDNWSITIDDSDLDWFTAWLNTHEGDTILNLAATETDLTVTDDRGSLTVPGRNDKFPKWQGMFRDALQNAAAPAAMVSVDTKMLARWNHADTHLRVWQTEPEKPLVLVGEDFLGMQMPCRYSGDNPDRALKKADPDLAETTVRDLNEQLESGEIGEWAWDAAAQAGHNPQQWQDDYEAHKQQLAEKQAAADSAA
jgi:hypothetical protein